MNSIFEIEKQYDLNINFVYEEGSFILKSISNYELSYNLKFNSLEKMVKFIRQVITEKKLKKIDSIFYKKIKQEKKKEAIVEKDNVINFPVKYNFFSEVTEKEWERATLCINNIHKPITEQDQAYKDLHDGFPFL